MKLSVQFEELGTMLIKQLLKCPSDKERMRGPVVNVATVELIYQLGKKQDSSYQDRYGKICHICFATEPSWVLIPRWLKLFWFRRDAMWITNSVFHQDISDWGRNVCSLQLLLHLAIITIGRIRHFTRMWWIFFRLNLLTKNSLGNQSVFASAKCRVIFYIYYNPCSSKTYITFHCVDKGGGHSLCSLYGYNSTRTLIGCWVGIIFL